jgi:hypothetical protein
MDLTVGIITSNKMGHGKPGEFHPPVVKGRWLAKALGATCWFFIFFRMYHDGGHHFVNH